MGERTRTTKDMDLVWQDDEQSATADLVACQSVDLDDFFLFVIQKAGRITEEQDGGAVRYQVRAELASRLFENVIVDIGFSDLLALAAGPDSRNRSSLIRRTRPDRSAGAPARATRGRKGPRVHPPI